jgi:hypothetical protein
MTLDQEAGALLNRYPQISLHEITRRLRLKFGQGVVYWPGGGWHFAADVKLDRNERKYIVTGRTAEKGERDVRDIHVREDASSGKWYATCMGPRGGDMTQWGDNAEEASANLRAYVTNIKGYTWPAVERKET